MSIWSILFSLVLYLVGFAVTLIVINFCEKMGNRAKVRTLSDDLRKRQQNACVAVRKCLAMCDAAALAHRVSQAGSGLEQVEPMRSGPSVRKLMDQHQCIALEALEGCLALSVDGLEFLKDARYVVLRSYFRTARNLCENCRPMAGQKDCPALEVIGKMTID